MRRVSPAKPVIARPSNVKESGWPAIDQAAVRAGDCGWVRRCSFAALARSDLLARLRSGSTS